MRNKKRKTNGARRVILLCSVFLFFACSEQYVPIYKIVTNGKSSVYKDDWLYVYSLASANKNNSHLTCTKYASYLTYYCERYNIPVRRMARQAMIESHFTAREVSWGVGALGYFQIRPGTNYYDYLLFQIDNGKLGRYIQSNNIPKSEWHEFYFDIKYNTEMACMIMSYYYRKYRSWDYALIAYLYGPKSYQLKIYRNGRQKWFWRVTYYRYVLEDGYMEAKEGIAFYSRKDE